MGFKPTAKQVEAEFLMGGGAQHILLVGGSRCVAGDTVIDGQTRTIAELAAIGLPVEVITSRGKQIAEAPFLKGRCAMLDVVLGSGRKVTVTPDHRFWDGSAWVKAFSLRVGSSVAARTCLQNPVRSSSGSSLPRLPLDVRRLIQRRADFLASCFSHPRRYDQPLLLSPVGAQVCRALRYDESARILPDLSRPSPFFEWLGSSIRTGRFLTRGAAYIRSKLQPYRLSNTDGFQGTYPAALSASLVFAPSYGQFQGSHLDDPLSGRKWIHRRSFAELWDAFLYRSCLFFGLSHDTPMVGGYSLDKVCSITETAEKEYYTLHVPVTEQYFANGILHHNSAKTFQAVKQVVVRALAAAGSRHAILRFRFNHVKASIVHDTFPKVMSLRFPGVDSRMDKTDWYCQMPNGSQIWFGGLDDKERTEKVLGQEYATIFLNECSQIPWASRNLAVTRLAQNVMAVNDKPLRLKMYYDENPPSKAHWSYKLFVQGRDPDTGKALPDAGNYAHMFMNPSDNIENLPPEYIKTLEGLPARMRERFMYGKFSEVAPGALWTVEMIEQWRSEGIDLPDMQRIVIGVDPSGAGDKDNSGNDAIGIIVGGLGVDGNGYVLEDLTVKAGPKVWGNLVGSAFDRWEADMVVAEKNYGGAMVKFVIQTARPRTPYREVNASRGKAVRAEPISALTEQGRIRFSGNFNELEDELCSFTTNGYVGEGSPNRADAFVWTMAELFPGIIKEKVKKRRSGMVGYEARPVGWMRA